MAKVLTDDQMIRLLKRGVKRTVRRHEECMIQRDNLIIALEDMIAAFCPGDKWAAIPVRREADRAIEYARIPCE